MLTAFLFLKSEKLFLHFLKNIRQLNFAYPQTIKKC
jgi:hypothetical protein